MFPVVTRSTVGEWLSLVEHLVRDQGVGGSNPLSPTSNTSRKTVPAPNKIRSPPSDLCGESNSLTDAQYCAAVLLRFDEPDTLGDEIQYRTTHAAATATAR